MTKLSQKDSLILTAIAFLTLVFSQLTDFAIDLSSDRNFTLSEASLQIAEDLEDELEIHYYHSSSLSHMPYAIERFSRRVAELLKQYETNSQGTIRIKIIDPFPGSNEERWALRYGVKPIKIKGSQEYFSGLVFLSGPKEAVIPFLDARESSQLEYQLSSQILSMQYASKPSLGIISSLPLLPTPEQGFYSEETPGPRWVIASHLEKRFTLKPLSLDINAIPESIQTLLVVHPLNMPRSTITAIQNYMAGGGRLVMFLDPLARFAPPDQPQGFTQSDLNELLKHWHIELVDQEVTGDLSLAQTIHYQGASLSYPYFLVLDSEQMDSQTPVTQSLDQVMLFEPGHLVWRPHQKLNIRPLLQTSHQSGVMRAMLSPLSDPERLSLSFQGDNQKRSLALYVQGNFPFSPEVSNQTSALGAAVIIADVDLLADRHLIRDTVINGQRILVQENDNIPFIENAIDFVSGDTRLLDVRIPTSKPRTLSKLTAIEKQLHQDWRRDDRKLAIKRSKLLAQVKKLEASQTNGDRVTVDVGQRQEIQNLRQEIEALELERRQLRIRQQGFIDIIKARLIAINVLAMPLFLWFVSTLWFSYKRIYINRKKPQLHTAS